MENSSSISSEKPLFTKLGLFTKRSYVVYLSFYLIIDYIYVLIFAKDKLRVLQFGIPISIAIFFFFNIFFFGGLYFFSKIKNLLGIDLTTNKQEKDLPKPLISSLFTEEGFKEFQIYFSERINKKWITVVAISGTILVVIFGLYSPFILFQADEWIENFPELAENGLYPLYLIFRIGPYSLVMTWFLISFFSVLLLIVELMITFNALGNFSGLSLSRISTYFENSSINRSGAVFSQKYEGIQLSLKRFRKKSKIIPEFFLEINLGISLVTFILAIMTSIYTSYILQEEARNFANAFIFVIISGIMLFNLIVFIFPQFSLHRQLDRVKDFFLENFEEKYEVKWLQYLKIDSIENSEEKRLLLSELRTLNQIIVDIESISTWPFNYNHLTTLIIGLIFPFLPLIFEILLL
jgi:hypothetical protein